MQAADHCCTQMSTDTYTQACFGSLDKQPKKKTITGMMFWITTHKHGVWQYLWQGQNHYWNYSPPGWIPLRMRVIAKSGISSDTVLATVSPGEDVADDMA